MYKKMEEFMKKIIIFAAIVAAAMGMHANAAGIVVKVDGNDVNFDQQPVIEDDRTLVPMRKIFEALGASVDWDDDTKTVTSVKDSTKIVLTVGSDQMIVGNENIKLDVPAKIINDRTMVPVRAISEAMKCKVDWDGEAKAVIITSDNIISSPTTIPTILPTGSPESQATVSPTEVPRPTAVVTDIADGENIFNPSWLIEDIEIVANTGETKKNEKTMATDFVPVNENKSYYSGYYDPNNMKFVGGYCINYAFYDADKKYISGAAADMSKPVKAPESASFVRFTVKLEDHNARAVKYISFIQTDKAPTEFVKSKNILSKAETDMFNGKKIFIVGDQQIQNATVWTNLVDERLGANIVAVKGFGNLSYRVNDYCSLCIDKTINTFPKDADYVIVSAGFYDWLNNYGIGDEYSSSGSIYDFISNTKTKWHNTKLVIMTIPNAKYAENGFTEGGMYNRNGLNTADYSELIKDACQKNNVPVIDVNSLWSVNDMDKYMKLNSLNYLYPNEDGCKLIADEVVKVLKELEQK